MSVDGVVVKSPLMTMEDPPLIVTLEFVGKLIGPHLGSRLLMLVQSIAEEEDGMLLEPEPMEMVDPMEPDVD